MTKKHIIESDVETYFKDQVIAHGGLPMKFQSPGKRGVPDQIVLYKGKSHYVEVKAPGKKPRKSQVDVQKEMALYDVPTHNIDTHKLVDHFIKNIMKGKRIKTPKPTKNNKQVIHDASFFAISEKDPSKKGKTK